MAKSSKIAAYFQNVHFFHQLYFHLYIYISNTNEILLNSYFRTLLNTRHFRSTNTLPFPLCWLPEERKGERVSCRERKRRKERKFLDIDAEKKSVKDLTNTRYAEKTREKRKRRSGLSISRFPLLLDEIPHYVRFFSLLLSPGVTYISSTISPWKLFWTRNSYIFLLNIIFRRNENSVFFHLLRNCFKNTKFCRMTFKRSKYDVYFQRVGEMAHCRLCTRQVRWAKNGGTNCLRLHLASRHPQEMEQVHIFIYSNFVTS